MTNFKNLEKNNYPAQQTIQFSAPNDFMVTEAACSGKTLATSVNKIMYTPPTPGGQELSVKIGLNLIYPIYYQQQIPDYTKNFNEFKSIQICFPDNYYMQYPAYPFDPATSYDATEVPGNSDCTYRDWYKYGLDSLYLSKDYDKS